MWRCPAVVAAFCVLAAPRADAAQLTILSPEPDAFISGSTPLSAEVEAEPGAAVRVSFFFDGTLVCEVDRPPYECLWDAGPGIEAHHVRVVATFGDGERIVRSVRTRAAGHTEHVDVDVVQVTATVTDERGEFVRGLPQDAFRVFENEVAQRVTHFAAENVPLEVVLAIDVSSSLADSMRQLKTAVKQFLAGLAPDDRVTLVAFNDNFFVLTNPEAAAQTRMRAVERLSAWGGTALYDALIRSISMLGNRQGRRAVVVFTDGDDQASHVDIGAVTDAVEASDATLYLVGQGRGTRLAPLRRILDRLAEASGGRALYSDRVETLGAAFGQIVQELSNQYLLIYPPTNAVRDNTWRRIRVELLDGPYRLRARSGYRAAARARQRSDR